MKNKQTLKYVCVQTFDWWCALAASHAHADVSSLPLLFLAFEWKCLTFLFFPLLSPFFYFLLFPSTELPSRSHQKYSSSLGADTILHNALFFFRCGPNAIYCCSTLFKRPDFSEGERQRQSVSFFFFPLSTSTESRLQPPATT